MRWRKTCYAESPWLPERSLTAWLRVSPCRASAILVRARSCTYSCLLGFSNTRASSVSALLVRVRLLLGNTGVSFFRVRTSAILVSSCSRQYFSRARSRQYLCVFGLGNTRACSFSAILARARFRQYSCLLVLGNPRACSFSAILVPARSRQYSCLLVLCSIRPCVLVPGNTRACVFSAILVRARFRQYSCVLGLGNTRACPFSAILVPARSR